MLRNQSQAAKVNARELRQSMTLPEVLLWNRLKKNGIGFRVRRQHPLGPYTLDFFLPEAMLCVEVDGEGHELRIEKDIARDKALADLGIRTLRFSAVAVLKNAAGVAEVIYVIACERAGRDPL